MLIDFGVNQAVSALTSWFGTNSSSGTITGNIPAALNNHLHPVNPFSLYRSASGPDLLNTISVSVWYDNRGVELHVATQFLSFWTNHAARHYNYGYGWDKGGGYARIAENAGTAGTGNPNFNPSGFHSEPQTTYKAVVLESFGRSGLVSVAS